MPEISRFSGIVIICWENEADFAPEFLYDLARKQEAGFDSSNDKSTEAEVGLFV